MWCVVLKERGEFEGIREHLESLATHRFERTTTGTGGEIFESPKNSGWPHLALVANDPSRVRTVLQWLNRNLPLTVVVSSGLVTPCTPENVEDPCFVPALCLRSAGRFDIGGSPVLYEEIPFDADTQREIARAIGTTTSNTQGRLFGADRELRNPETLKWVSTNLQCEGTDNFTSEVMLVGKRFGIRVGCLKIFENAKDSTRLLGEAWEKLLKPAT